MSDWKTLLERSEAKIAELEHQCAELQATMDSTLDDLRRMQAVAALAGLPPKVYAGLAGKAKGDRIDRLEQKCAELASMLRQVDEFLAGREIAAVGGTDYKAALHQLVTLETGILSRENVELAAVIKEVKDLYSDCPVCGKEEYAINGHLPGCALDVDCAAILAADRARANPAASALMQAAVVDVQCAARDEKIAELAAALEPFREVVAEFGRKVAGGVGILSWEASVRASSEFWYSKMLPLLDKHFPGWKYRTGSPLDPAAILTVHDAEVERRVLERVNSEDTEIIDTLAIYRAQVEREVTANLIGEASLVGWTDGNPPLAGPDIAIEDAEAWLERDRERVRRETLAEYGWRPIADVHEDYGNIVLCNANEPGGIRLSDVCSLSWDDDAAGMTHFAIVPAFKLDPREFGPKGDK